MTITNSPFLAACRREPTAVTPIWLMRQAGRYQASYRKIRSRYSMLELCQTPEAVVEVTLLPVNEFGVDAAILFSDITIPFLGMEVGFDIAPGVGPVIEQPIRQPEDIARLQHYQAEEKLPYISKSIRLLKQELSIPLIGFAGAPFTLAAYLIEGKPSRDFKKVREFMFVYPDAWDSLMSLLTEITIEYLTLQVKAGVDVVQVFDSWIGALHPEFYQRYMLSHMSRLFQAIKLLEVPSVHFGTGTASLLPLMQQAGGDVIGVDWRTPLGESWQRLNYECAIQGNLDPAVLFGPRELIEREVARILEEAQGRPGHIFNLGHGVLPGTPEDNVRFVVDLVRERSSR